MTVVYVTHDQGEALTMSSRIAVFNDGVIQQLATPEALYETPENAFVAQFIGENNKLHGKVKALNGQTCEVEIDGGGEVKALAVNVDAPGCRTMLSLRPERVVIEPAGEDYPNVFEGRVEELIYLGDHIRTRINVCGQDDFVVKVPNAFTQTALEKGKTIRVGWRIEDCRALDA